jgi:ribosome maturation protein SDO1
MFRETDLTEILQIEQIFTNVTKGLVAKKEDWEKAFNNGDMGKVVEEVGLVNDMHQHSDTT